MKKLTRFITASFLVTIIAIVTVSFKNSTKANLPTLMSETCSNWDGTGIQVRFCTNTTPGTNWISRTHQFYNGYNVKVHFYFKLDYANGSNSGDNGNIYLEPEEISDKAANDNYTGVNQTCTRWTITRKYKQDSAGKWVQF